MTTIGDVKAERGTGRREQILAVAAELFRRRGYAEIGIDEIGKAVGISGPAIYRHFEGKQELLSSVIGEYLQHLKEVWLERGGPGEPRAVLEAAIQSSIDSPDGYFVYAAQRHQLEPAGRARLESDRVEIRAAWQRLLATYGVELGHLDGTLKLATMQGMLIHICLTRSAGKAARARIAQDMAERILSAELPAANPQANPVERPYVLQHVNKREAVLAAATRLFRDSGFNSATLKDIGAEVEISASAIHRHFESKEAILQLILNRGTEQIRSVIDVSLRTCRTPRQAVRDMVGRYAVLFVENSDLFSISFNLLPDSEEGVVGTRKKRRKTNLEEVAAKLFDSCPDVTMSEASVRAGAMFSMLGQAVNRPALLARPELAAELTIISREAMLIGGP